ncbi:MAG: arabinan endo-1,5-alpha-L-arabinosidase [Acidobacteriaceae bacterium]
MTKYAMRVLIAAALAAVAVLSPAAVHVQQPQALTLTGAYWGTHDPSIIKAGDTWYVFATGRTHDGGQFQIRCSTDLHAWKLCGHVFDSIPAWIHKVSPGTRDLWAPDISYENGEYRLYYAYSLFGKNTSGIALVTNKTLDRSSPNYKWVDRGLVLKSTASDDYNAIDPNSILDAKGRAWLAFGSFWSGVKLRRLNEATGMVSNTDTRVYSLATRARPANAAPAKPGLPPDWEAIEAPFIVRHGRYYYLFVAWDLCCRGTKSTYRTMVGRSRSITGPYLDKNGVPMMQGGGMQLLSASPKWLGPGGASALMTPGHDLLVFHAYDAHTGFPAMQISMLTWKHGWPQAAVQQ